MKKSIFWKSYVAYAAVLLILVVAAVIAVNMVLTDYEAAQPERVVEQQIETIKDAIANNKLDELDFVVQLEQEEYGVDSSDIADYKEKIKNTKEFTYKVKTGSYNETEQAFYILADGEIVVEVTLESANERVALAILTLSDWSVKTVEPAYTHYAVELPKNFEFTLNGNKATATADGEKEDWVKYDIDIFACEPEIKIVDAYGQNVSFRVKDEQIVPVVYSYELRFPKGFSVFVGDETVTGVEDGEEMLYKFSTAASTLKLADAHGNTTDYKSGDAVYVYDYVVKLPENFKITINGKDASGYITSKVVDSKYQYCAEYANMPKLVTYEVKSAMVEPLCEIYDNLNQKVEASFNSNNKIEIVDQTPLATVPTDVINERELLDIAQIWSKFMTDDLTGTQHGFPTMSKYLIKDSYLYKVAYKWATSIDITFTSNHTLKTPPFTDEKITNFVSYGNNVYSCDISFKKHMYLVRTGETVIDETNSTFYFMLYDGTKDGKDNPTWVILDIREIISK